MISKKIIFFFFLISYLKSSAQVGVNTTTPSAQLDIVSSNQATPSNTDGILIPRINAFPVTNPTASQQSMMVYLTTTSGSNQPGFYYWDNTSTSWKGIGSTGWALTGNSGTSTLTNFIGTTDNRDLVFKRNSARSGYIGDATYDASFKYNNGNTSFGANSLLNPTISVAAQTGVRNVAIGSNVMPSLTSGNTNVGVGDFALFSNTSGVANTALGSGTLYSNSTGTNNVAIGRNSLTSANSNFNTAVGFAALRTTSSGQSNTAIGFNAGYTNSTGNGNIFIGNQAGYNETTSNKLYIDNTTADANNTLIYGDLGTTPKVFRTNSQLQIGNPAVSGYALPTTRGTNGQILQTDGAGATTWVDINSFSLVRTNLSFNQALNTSGWQKINFDTTVFDTKGEFNTTANRFIATKAGYYEINAGFHTDNQSNTQYYSIGVYKNGALYQMSAANHSNIGVVNRSINCLVSLNIGDYIEIFAENYQSSVYIDSYTGKSYFEIKQLK
ncbi:hypothetical protein OX284_010270 [Flavobacterium sp. SUN046]|uniref:hypothetical protein n=1 Tax=Flavobacterium sp. SUN046 TaxID=3002440 RepID=UPI002DBE3FB4|nr:hypothetical protein [Flavobacterium sp. SUN046]MEC4049813.1 hypothetical protein [Flavobacterium sp. SUN046]